MTTLTIEISDETFTQLKALADDAQISVNLLVNNMIQSNLVDDDEPSDEEILQSIRRGMIQALNGEGRPAREVLDEIDREYEAETKHAQFLSIF
jgi:predicted transcriptional regulator